ncbi:unnamed protein product [Durusdinium trenchii]|uniref:Uncharacterized protein n=1 Tax=Durusdinium trenchii TaxID=1381693 RepID=A0ABP0PYM0_9DINO
MRPRDRDRPERANSGSCGTKVAQPGYWEALYAESTRLNATDFNSSWQGVTLERLLQVLDHRLQLKEDQRVVVLGSGDSLLPEDLQQRGVADVIAIDLSPALQKLPHRSVRCLTEERSTRPVSRGLQCGCDPGTGSPGRPAGRTGPGRRSRSSS